MEKENNMLDENSKFCTYDEIKLDNKLGEINTESFNLKIKKASEQLIDFIYNKLILIENDTLISKNLKKFNYSSEKIFIYSIFTQRSILLIYEFYNIKFNKKINDLNNPNLDSTYITSLLEDKTNKKVFDDINSYFYNFSTYIKRLQQLDLKNDKDNQPTNKLKKENTILVNDEISLLKKSITEELFIKLISANSDSLSDDVKNEILLIITELVNQELKAVCLMQNPSHNSSLADVFICLSYLEVILDDFSEILSNLTINFKSKNLKKKKVNYEDEILNLYEHYSRLKYLQEFINQAVKTPENDIYNLSIESEEWKKLSQNVKRVEMFDQEETRRQITKIYDMIILSTSFVSKGLEIENGVLRVLGTGWYMANYFFSKGDANKQAKKFATDPKLEVARNVWGLLDTKVIKQGLKISLPSISFSEKFYFRKLKKPIEYEYLKQLCLSSLDYDGFREVLKIAEGKLSSNNRLVTQESDVGNNKGKQLIYKEMSSKEKPSFVKVKLIHCSKLFIPQFDSSSGFFNCYNYKSSTNITRDALIIHIHGGGFVAMSSTSHENYLRKWAKKLEVPILSIDYRLAPENPFPKALDDVFQAYCFIIKYAEEQLMININKLILVGDSAGGNLACSLVNLLILKNIRVPDLLCLAYPALRLDKETFSPSKILTLKDQILSINFVMLVREAYLGEINNVENDFFISPIYTPNHVRFI